MSSEFRDESEQKHHGAGNDAAANIVARACGTISAAIIQHHKKCEYVDPSSQGCRWVQALAIQSCFSAVSIGECSISELIYVLKGANGSRRSMCKDRKGQNFAKNIERKEWWMLSTRCAKEKAAWRWGGTHRARKWMLFCAVWCCGLLHCRVSKSI